MEKGCRLNISKLARKDCLRSCQKSKFYRHWKMGNEEFKWATFEDSGSGIKRLSAVEIMMGIL